MVATEYDKFGEIANVLITEIMQYKNKYVMERYGAIVTININPLVGTGWSNSLYRKCHCTFVTNAKTHQLHLKTEFMILGSTQCTRYQPGPKHHTPPTLPDPLLPYLLSHR